MADSTFLQKLKIARGGAFFRAFLNPIRALQAAQAIADSITISVGSAPVGTIVAWHKTFANTPALPDDWHECDGSTIDDTESPYNGQVLPDLNGGRRFLQGATTSGTFRDDNVKQHSHGVPNASGAPGTPGYTSVSGTVLTFNSTGAYPVAAGSPDETYPRHMEVVWIMRIKSTATPAVPNPPPPTLSYYDTAIALSPLVYYRFGEPSGVVADNVGSLGATCDGAYQGTLTLGVAGALTGDADTAVDLAGAGGNVKLDSTGFPAITDFSIVLWIKPNVAQGGYACLFGFGSGTFGFFLHSGAFLFYLGGAQLSAGTWDADVYQMVVLKREGSVGTIYKNGVPIGSGAVSTTSPTLTTDTYFGTDNSGESFVGTIDEGMFLDYAITDDDVLALYTAATS